MNDAGYRQQYSLGGRTDRVQQLSHISLLDGGLNTFVGLNAGAKNYKGTENAYVGAESATVSESSSRNVTVGAKAGYSMLRSDDNVVIGRRAGFSLADCRGAVIIGTDAGANVQRSSFNTLIGYRTGGQMISGARNTFVGAQAGFYTTNASDNVFVGDSAGMNNRTGLRNTMVGTSAGKAAARANDCVFIGFEAGATASNISGSVAVGSNVAASANSVSNSVIIGDRAASGVEAVANSVAVGAGAGSGAGDVESSVFVGASAGSGSTGGYNTFVGREAGLGASGNVNVALGYLAGEGLVGDRNAVMLGGSEYRGNASVVVGSNAGAAAAGDNSVFVGAAAGVDAVADNSVMIGNDAGIGSVGNTNAFVLGGYGFIGDNSVCIGDAGYLGRGDRTTLINAGDSFEGNASIAIGGGYKTRGDGLVMLGEDVGAWAGTGRSCDGSVLIGFRCAFLSDNVSDNFVADSGGFDTVAIGPYAAENWKGNLCSMMGAYSGATLEGDYNVAIGAESARRMVGDYNVAVGSYNSGNVVGSFGASLGFGAATDVAGDFLTAVGSQAAQTVVGDAMTAVGAAAGVDVIGDFNTALGAFSGASVRGDALTAVGTGAGASVEGSDNTFVGAETGFSTVGSSNTFVGRGAGSSTIGSFITAIGTDAAANVEGDRMTFVGSRTAGLVRGSDSFLAGQDHFSRDALTANVVTLSNVVIVGANVQHTAGNFSWYPRAAAFQPLRLSNVVVLGAGLDVSNDDSESFVVGLNSAAQDQRAVQFRNAGLYPDYGASLGLWGNSFSPSYGYGAPDLGEVADVPPGKYKVWFSAVASYFPVAADFEDDPDFDPTTNLAIGTVGTLALGTETPNEDVVSTDIFNILVFPASSNGQVGRTYAALSVETIVVTETRTVRLYFWGSTQFAWPRAGGYPLFTDWMNSQLRLVPMVEGRDASFGATIDPNTLEIQTAMVSVLENSAEYGSGVGIATPGPLFVRSGYYGTRYFPAGGNTDIVLCGGLTTAPRVQVSNVATTVYGNVSAYGHLISSALTGPADRLVKLSADGTLLASSRYEGDVGGGGGGGGGSVCNCWDAPASTHVQDVSAYGAGLVRVAVKDPGVGYGCFLVSFAQGPSVVEVFVVTSHRSTPALSVSFSATSTSLVASTAPTASASFEWVGTPHPVFDAPASSHVIGLTSADVAGLVVVTARNVSGTKFGVLLLSFVLSGGGTDVFVSSSHRTAALTVLGAAAASASAPGIVVSTDADCSVTWTFI